MKYRFLGSSGSLVSRITLGTMTFGAAHWGCDEEKYLTWFNKRNYGRFFCAGELHHARDLTTHAVCVGMIDSGKTGLAGWPQPSAATGLPVRSDPRSIRL